MINFALEEYKNLIKEERKYSFKQPYDLVYDNFIKLGYDKVSKEFFLNNASEVVEKLRNNCWSEFQPLEREFTSRMLKMLVNDDYIKTLTPIEAITWFAEEFPEHIYALTLSNT